MRRMHPHLPGRCHRTRRLRGARWLISSASITSPARLSLQAGPCRGRISEALRCMDRTRSMPPGATDRCGDGGSERRRIGRPADPRSPRIDGVIAADMVFEHIEEFGGQRAMTADINRRAAPQGTGRSDRRGRRGHRPAASAQPVSGGVEALEIKWSKAPCRFCGTGCGVMVGVKEGRAVATTATCRPRSIAASAHRLAPRRDPLARRYPRPTACPQV